MTRWCWYPDLAEDVLKMLFAQIQPALMLFIEGAGYLPDWDIVLMQTAYCLEPACLHPALLIECVPYTRPGSFLSIWLLLPGVIGCKKKVGNLA